MLGRYLSVAAIATAAAIVLAGCSSGGGGNGGGSTPGGGDEQVTLTFADWQWLEPGRGDRLWAVMQEFEKDHKNVTLKKQSATRADYEKTMQTQIGGGGGPDILVLPQGLLTQLRTADLLLPLDGVADDGHAKDETFDGKRLVYGWEGVNFGFFYNKNLLTEAGVQPPTDMNGVLEVAKAITAKTGKPGFAVRTSTSELQPWWSDFQHWVYGYGGGWVKGDKLDIDNPKNVEAVAMLKKLYDSGAMPIGDNASTFRSRFASGEIGMMFDNASVLFTILDGNDKLTSADVGVQLLPFPTNNSSQVTNYIGINKNSKHQKAALEFIKWLSSDAGQKASAAGIFPTLNATATAPPVDVVAKYPWISVYQEQSKTAKGSPVIPGFELQTPQISTIVMKAIEGVLVNNVDPDAALQKAQKDAEAL